MRKIPISFDQCCLRNQKTRITLSRNKKVFRKKIRSCLITTFFKNLVYIGLIASEMVSLSWSIGNHKLQSLFKVAMKASVSRGQMLHSNKSLIHKMSKHKLLIHKMSKERFITGRNRRNYIRALLEFFIAFFSFDQHNLKHPKKKTGLNKMQNFYVFSPMNYSKIISLSKMQSSTLTQWTRQ